MKHLLLVMVTILMVKPVFSQSCNKLQMALEFHNVTNNDLANPTFNVQDAECIEHFIRRDPLPSYCIPNDSTSRPSGVQAYYDLTGNGETDGATSAIAASDSSAVHVFMYYTDDATRLSYINAGMHHVNRQYTRRRCDGSLPQNCNAPQIMLDMHDFNNDGTINAADKACLDAAITTGGGSTFHTSYPTCARTDDPLKNYDVSNSSFANSPYSSRDSFLLQAIISGSKTAYELPNVKIVTDLHGCSQTAPEENPLPSLTIYPRSNQNYFNMTVGETYEVYLVHNGGVNGNLSVSTPSANISIAPVPNNGKLAKLTFNSMASGVVEFDAIVSLNGFQSGTTKLTFNSSLPATTSGTAPEFSATNPRDNHTIIIFDKYSRVGKSYVGNDAEGGDKVSVKIKNPENSPAGMYVSAKNYDPSKPTRFSGFLNFIELDQEFTGAHADDFFKSYTYELEARDNGNNTDTRTGNVYIYKWYEKITNPDAGNADYSISQNSVSNYYETDVAGTYYTNQVIRMNFEYPQSRTEAPIGTPWKFALLDQLGGQNCDNPGAVFEADPDNSHIGSLSFTPTEVGVVDVCIHAFFEPDYKTHTIYGSQMQRLRFNVVAGASPLQLNLAQTTFNATAGDLLKIPLNASGGTPGYAFRPGNIQTTLPAPNYSKVNSEYGQRFYNFISTQTSGQYKIDITVEDANTNEQTVTITINMSESLSIEMADNSAKMIKKTQTLNVPLNVIGGVGDITKFTYTLADEAAIPIPDWDGEVVGGADPQFVFTPDSSLDYSINNQFNIRVTVKDEADQTASVLIPITVSSRIMCPAGQYAATSELCCDNKSVLDPVTKASCVPSVNTMALIDKNDYMSEIGNAGFPSLCQVKVDTGENYIKVAGDITNGIEFVINSQPDASDYFKSTCRKFASLYSHYTIYHRGGDLNTGVTIQDAQYDYEKKMRDKYYAKAEHSTEDPEESTPNNDGTKDTQNQTGSDYTHFNNYYDKQTGSYESR